MKGYYLWDWGKSGTITFSEFYEFVDEDDANRQDAYRQFIQARAAGIADLCLRIDELKDQLKALRELTIEDVGK